MGVRKKILDGILGIHKREWDMPKQILPYNKSIRSVAWEQVFVNYAKQYFHAYIVTRFRL